MNRTTLLFLLTTLSMHAASLDEIACKYGTDKSSGFRRVGGAPGHNYTPLYEQYFHSLRHKPIKLLEIGFEFGLSAHMWDEYFTKGSLHFIDYHGPFFQYKKGLSDRCNFYVADQSNVSDLQQFINQAGGNFDIIIDDGSHVSAHQIISFEFLFPYVKSGGIYIIEDLHAAYWQEYGGCGTKHKPEIGDESIMTFLFSLIHELNYIGARTGCADLRRCSSDVINELNYYQKNIKSIHFYDSLCLIMKR